MQIHDDMKIQPSPEVLFQEVSGEMVLLDLSNEFYFGLNEVGTRVWQLLETGSSVGEVLDALLGEYQVERAALEKDVHELLGQLCESGLVTFES